MTDSQKQIDEDARKDFEEYWGCKAIHDCGDCPALMDGDEPWYSYGTGGSCREAQVLDLLCRQRELDKAGDQA